ncbi:hypothetical protein AB0901_09210 [Streptomyces roseifaciens]
MLQHLSTGARWQPPRPAGSHAGQIAHAQRVMPVSHLSPAQQDVGVHRSVAGRRRPLDRPVMPVRRCLRGRAVVAVDPGGELGGPGAQRRQFLPDGGAFAGGGIDRADDPERHRQYLPRPHPAGIGARRFVQRCTQVGDEQGVVAAADVGDGVGQVLQAGRIEQVRVRHDLQGRWLVSRSALAGVAAARRLLLVACRLTRLIEV